jgi:hypothetical protein
MAVNQGGRFIMNYYNGSLLKGNIALFGIILKMKEPATGLQ